MTLGRAAANVGLGLVLVEGAVSLVAGAGSELSWHQLMEGFVVSNTFLGLALALAGYPLARARPENRVGWLLLAGGVAYAFSGAGFALLAWGSHGGESAPGWRVLADLTSLSWPLAVLAFVPLALLFFPDGHLQGRRWLWAPVVIVGGALLFEALVTLGRQDTTSALHVDGYLRLAWVDDNTQGLWLAMVVLSFSGFAACLVSLLLHHRRGDERSRRQILWLLLATIIVGGTYLVSELAHLDSWVNIFVIALVPIAIAVAILRHQLFDIRLVVSRSLLYLTMTALVVAAYVLIVAGTDRALAARVPVGPPVLATMAIALAFNPVREILQSLIDRAFYGMRQDPVRAFAEIGSSLGQAGLTGVLQVLCNSLHFPWAVIEVDGGALAAYGPMDGLGYAVPLDLGERVGRLTVGLRRGEQTIARRDEELLGLVSGSLSVAVQANKLAEDLESARLALVTAREEERRRLGRDLHDGLGPVLTGVTLLGDAARRIVETDPKGAASLLAEMGLQTTAAVNEIRRLASELRPPALDSLGLVGALEQHARMLEPIHVSVYGSLPPLPVAIEVAAYRIATEALTNAVRHSSATSVNVRLDSSPSHVHLCVTDNGSSVNGSWVKGVGLTSMHERATELGGTFVAGPAADGGRVEAAIPREGQG